MNTSNFVSIPAQMFPDQEQLVFESVRLTYGELWERIQRTANALRDLGVRRGDRVAVLQTNSDQYVEAYFAAAALGAVFVPVNYRAKPPELEYMIDSAETKVRAGRPPLRADGRRAAAAPAVGARPTSPSRVRSPACRSSRS